MAASTAPILLVGGMTILNESLFNGQPIDWKVPVATGFAAGAFALMEKATPQFAVGLAWLAVGAVLLIKPNSKTPSFTESAMAWFSNK